MWLIAITILLSLFLISNLPLVNSKMEIPESNTSNTLFYSILNENNKMFIEVINCSPTNRCIGTPEDDNITGTNLNDQIFGLSGNDQIFGLSGNDSITGNIGNDNIYGNKGDDNLYGDEIFEINKFDLRLYDSNDRISGDIGNDNVDGGIGDDFIEGGKDNDILQGNYGSDYIFGDEGNDLLFGFKKNDSYDESIDYIDCGPGNNDTAYITQLDSTQNCENILLGEN